MLPEHYKLLFLKLMLLTFLFLCILNVLGFSWRAGRVTKNKILVHVPTVWTIRSLFESANTLQMSRDSINYVPARPQVRIGGLAHRCRCAYLAFTGRCDLVRWPADQ